MPLPQPALDNRTFQDLVAELLARIPVHNPEWTNFNRTDPGVTILEMAAFLLENDIYVANQIPERNRRKFLQLLGVPLHPATSARGLVAFSDENGPLMTLTMNDRLEVRAGEVPFRTTHSLHVLPVEAQVFFKRAVDRPDLLDYYKVLYASHTVPPPVTAVGLYETVPLPPNGVAPDEAIDRSLWIALLARPVDKDRLDDVRRELAGRTLSLGVAPVVADGTRRLAPARAVDRDATNNLRLFLPKLPARGVLPEAPALRQPEYEAVSMRLLADVMSEPGVVEVTLPSDPAALALWANLHPLELGVGDFPPAITDTEQAERLITWLRVRSPVKVMWMGINCASVSQRAHVTGEVLPDGTGEPDQKLTLSRTPVVPSSVQITVTLDAANAEPQPWQQVDDLLAAEREPSVPRPLARSGAATRDRARVFVVDPESGEVRFGDGIRGARPPAGARIRADYDYGVGRRGNVGTGIIQTSPALPGGWTVTNPVPTWGGADAESVDQAEKQVPRFLQHRDRLVTAEDFEVLALRTPGVEVGRVEVLPAFHPDLAGNLPGDAAGVVTLMLVPKYDAARPEAPEPDRYFLDAVACWLDRKRLVTTELILRGPSYVRIMVSMAIEVVSGAAQAQVREAVRSALVRFLSPLPPEGTSLLDDRGALRGWPLQKPVIGLELQAVASRVDGVQFVHPVRLYKLTALAPTSGSGQLSEVDPIPMNGLELPELVGVEVTLGDSPPSFSDTGATTPPTTVPVPVIPEVC